MPASPYRILVVDDNPATLYSTCRVLRGAGFELIQATTGSEALERAMLGPDLIVLDVELPDIDGFAVCRRLREQSSTRRTPVIHLSATFVSDVSKVEGLEAGADGYLTHPVEPPVLVATVNAFLRAREAETALRTSEAKFRAMFDQALLGISLLSLDLEITEANPKLCQILGYDRNDLVEADLRSLLAADADIHEMVVRRELAANSVFRGTLPLCRRDGSVVQTDWIVTVYTSSGISLAMIVDATERLRIESEREQLLASERAARTASEQANRIKDDFLATLSHELRTPLSAILGWAQIFRIGRCSVSEVIQGAEVIERNANIQTQLISDLLDVSRITSGKLRLDTQILMPAEIVASAMESVAAAAEARGIQLRQSLDTAAGPILADSSRLQQVVWNLINNAVKFTPKGGCVDVTLRRADSSVEIEVRDNGQGIAAEFLPFIFDRFRQGDATTRRGHGGLGLGLSIVKQLVELHGGSVSGQSEGVDLGATFIVTLPITGLQFVAETEADLSKPQPLQSELAFGHIDLSDLKVLIVDDDDDTRRLIQRVLQECGAEATTASNVVEALISVDVFRPNLLISDIGMPGRDGYDLIQEIRARSYTPETLPAIALTAFARSEDRERALNAGYQSHLRKPVDPSVLLRYVQSLRPQT